MKIEAIENEEILECVETETIETREAAPTSSVAFQLTPNTPSKSNPIFRRHSYNEVYILSSPPVVSFSGPQNRVTVGEIQTTGG